MKVETVKLPPVKSLQNILSYQIITRIYKYIGWYNPTEEEIKRYIRNINQVNSIIEHWKVICNSLTGISSNILAIMEYVPADPFQFYGVRLFEICKYLIDNRVFEMNKLGFLFNSSFLNLYDFCLIKYSLLVIFLADSESFKNTV